MWTYQSRVAAFAVERTWSAFFLVEANFFIQILLTFVFFEGREQTVVVWVAEQRGRPKERLLNVCRALPSDVSGEDGKQVDCEPIWLVRSSPLFSPFRCVHIWFFNTPVAESHNIWRRVNYFRRIVKQPYRARNSILRCVLISLAWAHSPWASWRQCYLLLLSRGYRSSLDCVCRPLVGTLFAHSSRRLHT